jgi:hypothetical protein
VDRPVFNRKVQIFREWLRLYIAATPFRGCGVTFHWIAEAAARNNRDCRTQSGNRRSLARKCGYYVK